MCVVVFFLEDCVSGGNNEVAVTINCCSFSCGLIVHLGENIPFRGIVHDIKSDDLFLTPSEMRYFVKQVVLVYEDASWKKETNLLLCLIEYYHSSW